MEFPYENYKKLPEWEVINKAIQELVENQDLVLKTPIDYITGYLIKQIKDSDYDKYKSVTSSANRALWQVVTPHLRGVTVDYKDKKFTLRAYFDKGASENDKELMDCALAEISSDFWFIYDDFIYEPIDLDFPNEMTMLHHWVYLRNEDF